MFVLALTGMTKSTTGIWESMGQAGISIVTFVAVVGTILIAALLIIRALAPLVRDIRASVEANALLAERLENAIDKYGCNDRSERVLHSQRT